MKQQTNQRTISRDRDFHGRFVTNFLSPYANYALKSSKKSKNCKIYLKNSNFSLNNIKKIDKKTCRKVTCFVLSLR